MARGLVPDVVGHRIGTVAEPGDGFGEGQGGALGSIKIGRIAPGGDGKQAVVGIFGFLETEGQVDADDATVNLAGAPALATTASR